MVKPGGRILLLGACSEGVGSPEYAAKLRAFPGNEAYLREIGSADVVVDQWQLEKLALVGLKNQILFYTPGVTASELGAYGPRHFSDVNAAVRQLLAGLPAKARVVLIPEGPYTFARVMA